MTWACVVAFLEHWVTELAGEMDRAEITAEIISCKASLIVNLRLLIESYWNLEADKIRLFRECTGQRGASHQCSKKAKGLTKCQCLDSLGVFINMKLV